MHSDMQHSSKKTLLNSFVPNLTVQTFVSCLPIFSGGKFAAIYYIGVCRIFALCMQSRGGWNRKLKSHDLRARYLQAGSFGLPRQEFAGLFLEIWTLLANFAVPSEGPRRVGY